MQYQLAIAICVALLLTACGPKKDQNTSDNFVAPTADVEDYEKTVFSVSREKIGAVLGELGAPWNAELMTNERPDSFSGGTIINTLFSAASHDVFVNGEGRVWRVRLNAGIGSKCGDKASLVDATKRLIPILENGVMLSESSVDLTKNALAKNEIYEVKLDTLRVSFSGDCVSSATISAQ